MREARGADNSPHRPDDIGMFCLPAYRTRMERPRSVTTAYLRDTSGEVDRAIIRRGEVFPGMLEAPV